MKVTLRQRIKGEKVSLYLDYYHQGKREYEYLQLYLFPDPEKGKLSKEHKESNKETLALAESIRSKRQVEIQNGIYGFQDQAKLKGSFLRYVENIATKPKASQGNHDNWDSALKHLKKYVKFDITFGQVDKAWLEGFKSFLQYDARKSSNQPLSPNSQSSYFNKIRAALKQAYKEGHIKQNPSDMVDGIKAEDPERDFLTYEELQAVVKAECEIPLMKTAFLFSCLTGLRWSDIQKLLWSEVQFSNEIGYYIRFRQKKTKGTETLPISEQAYNLLGEKAEPIERVFKGLKYSAWHNLKLQQWVMRAGISKTITFHCARHTYATLQLTLGTDIYTVSKLLGHKDLKTTQVYAKIIDDKKKEAANKIVLNL